MLCLCGCGHNAIVFDKGLGFRAGFDPEHLSADVRFVYGEALTLAVRDNIELEWVSDAEGGQEQSSADAKLLNERKPTEKDIDLIKKIFQRARKEVRDDFYKRKKFTR